MSYYQAPPRPTASKHQGTSQAASRHGWAGKRRIQYSHVHAIATGIWVYKEKNLAFCQLCFLDITIKGITKHVKTKNHSVALEREIEKEKKRTEEKEAWKAAWAAANAQLEAEADDDSVESHEGTQTES